MNLEVEGIVSQQKEESGFSGQVEMKKWEGPPLAGRKTYGTLGVDLEPLAADAERSVLLRMTGHSPDIFDATMFRNMAKEGRPLYIIADKRIALPQGPPLFILADANSDLEEIARESKKNVYYISLRCLGTVDADGETGVVMEYRSSVVNWERAAWNALPEEEKRNRDTPKFRSWLFGAWATFWIVRNGDRLVVYEDGMWVS